MDKSLIFLTMVFFHTIADYNLQGILASMKQSQWWTEMFCDDMEKLSKRKDILPEKVFEYKMNAIQDAFHKSHNDFIMALFMHSFSWAFMIMLPILYYYHFDTSMIGEAFYISFAINTIIHMYVDHMKANMKKINLVTDQLIHLVQITFTFICLI